MQSSLTILGTSAAVPTAQRFCSGQLLRFGQETLLIDCGEGTQIQLQKAGVGFNEVSLILISHLHGDHYFGLPALLTSWALHGRTKPLLVISPPGLRQRVAPMLELDQYPPPFDLRFQVHSPTGLEEVWASLGLSVLAFPLVHRIPTNGYVVREKNRLPSMRKEAITQYEIPHPLIPAIKAGADFVTATGKLVPNAKLVEPALSSRAFAFCSDTRYEPAIVPHIEGVDLLYHEATFLHADLEKAIKTMHTTALEAGRIAAAARVKTLVIGHFSARYDNVQLLEAEARQVFPKTYAAQELMCFEVPYQARAAARSQSV